VKSEALRNHLQIKHYGRFTLTDAVRPALSVPIRPREGYEIQVYRDREVGLRLPMLTASVSAEHLFDVFFGLVGELGEELHVVVESSHRRRGEDHIDYRREHVDAPVLLSHLCDFEELLLNDGCTGIAVMSAKIPMEVQFDEHKLLCVYAPSLKPFRHVLKSFGVPQRKQLPMISEAEHLHYSTDAFEEQFEQLALRLGVSDFDSVTMDESFDL
jgi:hypothetical protein